MSREFFANDIIVTSKVEHQCLNAVNPCQIAAFNKYVKLNVDVNLPHVIAFI